MIFSILVFILFAFIADGAVASLQGMIQLQTHPARLINDYTAIGGTGGALLNAAVLGVITLALIFISKTSLSGPTVAAIFTVMGFALFGKTALNSLPIMLGVFVASRIAGKPMRSYILMALFGTALGPLVTFVIYEMGLTGVPALLSGLLAGIVVGILLPGLAMAMLRMHEGFNLYNIGLTCGFLGLFAASLLGASRQDLSIVVIWNELAIIELILLVPTISILFIVWGAAMDGKKLFSNLKRILSESGRLPSDFMESVSPGSSLVNAGLLGLAFSAYLMIIGADINGPVIGGLMTIIGFAPFGKHARNCWPVAAGVIAATLLFGQSLTAPAPVLGLLFGTTLAPLAGEFGVLIGFAAGFTHLIMVIRTAAWHGGLDLYNNGFAGGLTATFFVAIIQWVRSLKEE